MKTQLPDDYSLANAMYEMIGPTESVVAELPPGHLRRLKRFLASVAAEERRIGTPENDILHPDDPHAWAIALMATSDRGLWASERDDCVRYRPDGIFEPNPKWAQRLSKIELAWIKIQRKIKHKKPGEWL